MDKSKNVFISHFNQDEENIGKMKNLLSGKGYTIKNSSIDSTKPNQATHPEYIKRLLRMRIHWAGTFICLIGPKSHTRPWIDWEIEQANKKGKRIIGVYINGASDSDVPDAFDKFGNALVGWTADRIIGAIEGTINNWESSSGEPRAPRWSQQHDNC
ncbi:MAG: TIR domain-containing protein [Bacteroidales bacterium]|nr:TIR domain-containing protein [Bacteroidales bacterium]